MIYHAKISDGRINIIFPSLPEKNGSCISEKRMDKVFQILVVFALLMLVITYSVRVRERKIRPFYLFKKIILPFPGDPEWNALALGLVSVDGEDETELRISGSAGGDLAIDQENHLSFRPGEGATISVIELSTGEVVNTILPDEQADSVAFDPTARLVFSYSREGAMSIVQQNSRDRYIIVQRMLVPKNGSALVADPKSGKIYLVAGSSVFVYANS
jgi:hypothetical protein